jgi:adenylate cyclase
MGDGHFGELVPVGGGDAIPLVNDVMTIGRRPSCDIRLNFQNISGTHCELSMKNGIWYIRDLNSTNGVKVNGERTLRRPLRPGDEIDIAKHKYVIQYQLTTGTRLEEVFAEEEENVFGQSLLEKAGLEKPNRPGPGGRK